jgi:hypothetical protein
MELAHAAVGSHARSNWYPKSIIAVLRMAMASVGVLYGPTIRLSRFVKVPTLAYQPVAWWNQTRIRFRSLARVGSGGQAAAGKIASVAAFAGGHG